MRILIMGGTRFTGRAITTRALHAGHDVTLVHRGTHHHPFSQQVTEIIGDREHPDTLAKIRGSQPDAVVDLSAYYARQTQSLLDSVPDVRLWVHTSSGAIYQPSPAFPWPEDLSYGPWPLWGGYGREKLGCEQLLHHRDKELTTIVFRMPYVLGPGNYALREEFIFNRLLDDETILIPGDGSALMQFIGSDQVAESYVRALHAELNPGFWAFNLADHMYASAQGLVELCADIADATAHVVHVPDLQPADEFDKTDHPFPFPNRNYLLDIRKAQQHGLLPTPARLEDLLHRSFAYLMSHPERRRWERTKSERGLINSGNASPLVPRGGEPLR